MYAQLAVLDAEKPLRRAPATPVAFHSLQRDSDIAGGTAPGTSNSTGSSLSGSGCNAVPLLGWELMREFFGAYCGVPELMLLSSRQFQHDSFAKDFQALIHEGFKL